MSERRLRNAAAPLVATVESAEELLEAVAAGTTNIEIRQHLDLRLGEDGGVDDYDALLPVFSFVPLSVRTIRGNCTQPPAEDLLPEATDDTPGVFQMLPMRQNQCLVLLDTALLQAEGRLWLDGLYVRLQRPHSFSAFIITVWPGIGVPLNRRGLWMTDVTVQSDSGPHFGQESGLTWGVQVGEIDFLARDCTFANLGGEGPVSAVDVVAARADLVDCAFRDNYMGGPDEGIVQGINNASIALHRPSFSGNSGDGHLPHFDPHQDGRAGWAEGVENRVKYFSDDPAIVDYCQNRNGLQPMQPLAMSDTNFVFMQSWLERKQEELGIIQRPLPAEASSSELKANDMGCCNINCFDYDYASPPLTPAVAVAPQQAPQQAPMEAPQQAPLEAPQQAPAPAPSTAAAAAGQNETNLPAAADAAPAIFTQQPRGMPLGAAESAPGLGDSSERGAARQGPGVIGAPPAQADDGLGVGTAVAIALGVILVALLALFAAFMWWRRQHGNGKADPIILDASKEAEPLAAVDSVGSINFGPHLGGVPQHAQHASATSRTAGAAAAAGAAGTGGNTAGVDASGGGAKAGASGSGADPGGLLEPALPQLEPGGSIGSMNAATAACTTMSIDAEPTQAIASRLVRFGEVVPQADMELVRNKTTSVTSGVAFGRAGLKGQELQRGSSAGEGADGGVIGPMAQMRAMFHQPTELGTLAETDAWRTLAGGAQDEAQHLAEGATVKERLAFIGSQLDAFGRRGVVLDQYEMLGGDDRCQGGQAVVQFVRAPHNNHLYAIKLFASRSAYDDEKHLYLHYFPTFMPTVVQFVDNEDGKFRDPLGAPMPPCFVMEKGESLTERIMRCKNDIFTTIQIIGQVASCLAELHGQGWVHRDLKPGNIMFLPRTGSWTLIDFGLAARAGEAARIGFTPTYAAPEVVAAHAAGDGSVTADTAVDAWALGVIAFELLSRRPAFDALSDPGSVERQLLGEEPLPWEGDRLTSATERRLGNIKAPVLRMLCRDPAERASCKQLASSLRAVFTGGGTTVEQPAEVPT